MQRYTFWLQSNGLPYQGQDSKFAMTAVLSEIGNLATVKGTTVSWRGFEVTRYLASIRPAISVRDPSTEKQLNGSDTWNIAQSAITNVIRAQGGGKPISSAAFLKAADKLAAEFFRRPNELYTLVTSLSVDSLPSRSLRLGDATIVAIRNRKRYPYPKIISTYPSIERGLASLKYCPVAVKVQARTTFDAIEIGLSRLQLLRSLWTLFDRYGAWTMSFGSIKSTALAAVHLGPVHSVCLPDGTTVDDMFCYEKDAEWDAKIFKPSSGWDRLEKNRKWGMRQLRVLPYGRDLQDVVCRYGEALDQTNPDVAFLHMWGVLERITDTVGANYDETIRRATWSYPNRVIASELLGSMRLHRNRFVHSTKSVEHRDEVASLMKSFVEPHLLRLLRNDFDVPSLQEYGKYQTLPTDLDALRRLRLRVNRAIAILKPRSTRA